MLRGDSLLRTVTKGNVGKDKKEEDLDSWMVPLVTL